MEHDLTRGTVAGALTRFVLPFLGASILQFLYAVVDMIIVGQFSDAAAISAVNTSSQIMQLVTGILSGITTGGTVLIGQYIGANREKDVRDTVSSMFALFLIMAVLITAGLLLLKKPIISMMQVPPEAVEPALGYLTITAAGTVFIAGYNGIAGILRGLGDSKLPMYFIACSCILNITGDLLLVGVFRLGAPGAAYATVFAQAVSCVLSIFVLRRGNYPFEVSVKGIRLVKGCAGRVLRVGIPVAAQDALVTLSFVIITAVVNNMGLSQSAAVGVVERIIGFCMLVPIAFLSALSAFTAQNVGAGEEHRAKQGLRTSVFMCFPITLIFFAVVQLFPQWTAGLFTGDVEVILNSAQYLRTYSFDIILVTFVFCFNGFFSGYGHTGFTMANGLISTFAVRVPLVFLMSFVPGTNLTLIGIAAPAASCVQIIMQIVYYRLGKWKRNTIIN